ncbi:MAG: hypothetical protein QNJ33_13885 [Crocosphaera sp.]|nr:hypothetical protein [Crocosphaera sp.]
MQTDSSHYQTFQIYDNYKIPSSLHDLLYQVWNSSYEELYEESIEETISLEELYVKILNAFEDNNFDSLHYHYLLMAMIMSQAVLPTIKAYLPDDTRPQKVYQYIDNYLENKITLANSEITTIINELFLHPSEGNQAIDEALDVFKNLLRVIDFEGAKEALLNILDDCLEGYAIFPGSQGKRDLFNWWLLEVVPAVWCLQFPETVYTIKGLQDTKNTQERLNNR